MARAKRTARADARRRYRATMVEDVDQASDEAEAEVERSAPRGRPAPAPKRAAEPPRRPSIVDAFRTSFRPLDLRGDVRALPRLLMTKAFLIPAVVAGAVFIVWALTENMIAALLMQYVAYPFAVAPVFAVGFFASRAGYLLGAIVSVLATLFTIPLLVAFGADSASIGVLAIQNAVYGAFFGGAAAWYRRFLKRANPNLARQGAASTSRRPDGKIPRKQAARPILARRR